MSLTKDNNVSDDEFQDAISDVPITPVVATKPAEPNEKLLDEMIEKHAGLKISENGIVENDSAEEAEGGLDEEEAGGDTNKPKNIDSELTEDELRIREKDLTPEQLEEDKSKAAKLKQEANDYFKNDEAEQACKLYTDALNICPLSNAKDRAVLFGNRAAAKIKLDAKKAAIDDCTKAIELWPEYVRALMRRAKLYEQEDKLDEALEDYKRVFELDRSQHEAAEAIARLPSAITERNERLKTEMMSSLKDLGNMILKPFGLSTSNFQMQQDPNTGSYSINFNQNAS